MGIGMGGAAVAVVTERFDTTTQSLFRAEPLTVEQGGDLVRTPPEPVSMLLEFGHGHVHP